MLTVLFVLYLVYKKSYKYVWMLLLSLGSYPYGLLLKELFKLPRPDGAVVRIYFQPDIYGFPSTHTVFYMAFWGSIIYLTYKIKGADKVLMHVVRLMALVLILTIGISRVFLGVHSVYDVIGGYLFGLAYFLVLVKVDRVKRPK